MAKFQIDGTALAVTILAAAVGFSLLSGPFSWLASIAGLVLAIVLLAFDQEGTRTVFGSLGFSAAVGLCLTLASAVVFRMMLANQGQGQTQAFDGPLTSEYLPLFWVAVTVFVWVVDRSRMPSRVVYQAPVPVHPQATQSFTQHSAPAPAPTPVPPVTFATPPPEPKSIPVAPVRTGAFTQPSFASSLAEAPPPAAVAPVMPPAPVVAEPPVTQLLPAAAPTPVAPTPTYADVTAPVATAPPPPTVAAIPPGKEATVYVTLVGEGLNVLRAVRAEHLGRDYYRIAEEMPPGEIWQFGPGQVVRAKKKNLSSGKAMVAFEEAPRAAQ